LRSESKALAASRSQAPIFAALGDETRLSLVKKLSAGERLSISQLAANSKITRQAVTKHLKILERVRIVRGIRAGRESLFELDPKPINQANAYLQSISEQWDEALASLKSFVEE
jgi:DNA-binding transcriptional ArsR family regulator